MPPDKEPKPQQQTPGFTSANQITPDEWMKRHQINFQDCMTGLDIALEKAKPHVPEGWGLLAHVACGDVTCTVQAVPPAPVGGYGGGGGGGKKPQEPAKALTLATVQQAVTPYQDKLSIEEKDGKIIVKPKKFLGDEWPGINTEMQKAGLRWAKQDPNDPKSGAWTAPKGG